jgi:sporulation protein YlmC with PRC-barrel domain
MAEEAERLTIGSAVGCSDEEHCGKLTRVVVDPVAKAVTHIVVQPRHGVLGRLVPLEMVILPEQVEAEAPTVQLSCTAAELEALTPAEETEFLPGTGGYGNYSPEDVLTWPYYGLGIGGGAMPGMGAFPPVFTHEELPPGEVAMHRGEQVHASDGDIGHVQGLVVDPSNHHVTHVLLQEGHLWGRKQVAIPIRAVLDVRDGIRLSLSKEEIADLPPVELDTSAT